MELALLASRLLLAAVFLLAGSTKLVNPGDWRKALRDFSLPSALTKPAMVLLPVVELSVALAMLSASLAWYGVRGAFGLVVVFMLAVGFAMIQGRKPDCHCFGQLHSAPVGWRTLVRNALLGGLAGWLLLRAPDQLGPSLWTWYNSLGVEASKIVAAGAGIAAIVFFAVLLQSRPRPETVLSASAEEEQEEESPEETPSVQPEPRLARRAPSAPAPPAGTLLGIGLPVGTLAPEFELPGMTGDKRSLCALRAQGRDVLLVFSSPFCTPCEVIPSNLVRWARELEQLPNIVLISKGKPEDNRPKLKEFGSANVLLQRASEVAEMYDCMSTPSAVLIGADGLVRSELVTGGPAIKELLQSAVGHLPTR